MVTMYSLLLLLVAVVTTALDVSSLDGCGQTCVTTQMNNAGAFACGADDLVCLCAKVDWGNGIRDCALETCGGVEPQIWGFISGHCQAVGVPIAAAPAAPLPGPNLEATPTPAAPTPTPTPDTIATTPVETPTTPATPVPTPSEASSSISPISTPTSSHSGPAATSSAADDDDTEPAANDGMSVGQVAGLTVGMIAVVVAFFGVGFFLFMRKRRAGGDKEKAAADRYNISPPVPPQGPYMHENASSVYEGTHGSNNDLKAFRYEEMVPRVQPLQMV
ncbi:hypothetical protein QBC38DRAFT_100143 [Podospora fimiseda]|uniref:CFEM domain-containing protein n=1 Tax=Podospora fimiseda TaxID=252190 RepID=A0AAN6YSL9_9PEZI|nr:hypothetical protein QBC38DRAFT_100143 [Podospora fimiseda]